MEPFGPDNMRPVFVSRGVRDTGYSKIVKEVHLKLSLREKGATLQGIFFNGSDYYDLVKSEPIDIVYTLDLNEFNGQTNVQMKVMDIKATAQSALNDN